MSATRTLISFLRAGSAGQDWTQGGGHREREREYARKRDGENRYLLRHAVAPLDSSQRILVTVVVVETGTGSSRGRAVHDVALRPRERSPRLGLPERLALARLLLLLLRLLVGALELEEVFDLFLLPRQRFSVSNQCKVGLGSVLR